jgi:hypothetical protein
MGPRPCLGVACTPRKATRAQHQVGRGWDSGSGSCPVWARLKVEDDRCGPPFGDRERREVEWAAAGPEASAGLRPTTVQEVAGERDEGGPADFRRWAWPN